MVRRQLVCVQFAIAVCSDAVSIGGVCFAIGSSIANAGVGALKQCDHAR